MDRHLNRLSYDLGRFDYANNAESLLRDIACNSINFSFRYWCSFDEMNHFFFPETVFKLAPNRKRIHTAVDSSGDEESSPNKTELTVKEKETRLIAVKQALPQCDTMVN